MNVQEMLDRLEEEQREQPERYKQRIDAWKLRIQGYVLQDIADTLGITIGTAHNHIRWCQQTLPSAHEGVEDFVRTSLERLEQQYQQLLGGRLKGDEVAERVSLSILDMQAKLLGAYTQKIDVTQQVNYTVDGVDVDKA